MIAAGVGTRRPTSHHRRRLLLLLLVVVGACIATSVFAGVLVTGRPSFLDAAILGSFFLCFAWISGAFWTAIAGFVVLRSRPAGEADDPGSPLPAGARTAIVMPVYHEDPDQVGARIAATYRSLEATGQADRFEWFILSDSRDPEVVRAEQDLWARLCRELDAGGRLFYRNRADNRGRKAGNIAEFCRRWGGRYRYFVVLDADSVMSGATLVRLVQLMEAAPNAGLIQTAPRPIGGTTLIARILQFAASLHGPMLATGLSYWFPGASNYWGHNAIIRTDAFMGSAGLPMLPGRPPLGGEILSHDFVEAALLRRAGWSVWLVPDLGGSYEELPPTLGDLVRRDRRWCQGNLQHLRLLTMKGLRATNRAHLLTGALAYLSSPLWLTLLASTTLEAMGPGALSWTSVAEAASSDPEWPVARRAELLGLFAAMLAMLMLPRFLALAEILADPARRRAFGGAGALVRSAVAELFFSIALAPVLMVEHTRVVIDTILGRREAWNGQQRGAGSEDWRVAVARYGGCTALGGLWAVTVFAVVPELLPWLLPVLAGLFLAVPLAVLSSRSELGLAALRRGWFVIPEEIAPPAELADLPGTPAAPGRTGPRRAPVAATLGRAAHHQAGP